MKHRKKYLFQNIKYMTNNEISVTVRKYGNVLPFKLYRDICGSPQVDHVLRTGDRYQIWTSDGCHWEVTVKPD